MIGDALFVTGALLVIAGAYLLLGLPVGLILLGLLLAFLGISL